jgi:imidazolonepropionase-like amidohydrolase
LNDCFALKGGTLIDGTGRGPINNSIVVVRGSVIEKVGEKGEIDIPREAKVIDISGKTIMPGLIDAHTHLTLPETPNITAGWISIGWADRCGLKGFHKDGPHPGT